MGAARRWNAACGCVVGGVDGNPQAIIGVCTDITERVQASRALGLSERRMRAILDYTPSIVAVKDLDGRYLMSNAETGLVLGIPADEVIGRYCTELFPQIAEQLRENDRLAAAEMEPVYDETPRARLLNAPSPQPHARVRRRRLERRGRRAAPSRRPQPGRSSGRFLASSPWSTPVAWPTSIM